MREILHRAQQAVFTQMIHYSNKDALDPTRRNIYSPANKISRESLLYSSCALRGKKVKAREQMCLI